MKQIGAIYSRYQKYIENFIFPLILVVYPLVKINQGIDVSDTTYSLGNFQYFGSMDGTWMVATFLANAVGNLLMHLPFGGTLMGMYFYTALFQSVTAGAAYLALRKKMPAAAVFLGELMALGLCWCPSTILYNYLTYLLMTAGMLLLYYGVLEGGCAGGKGVLSGQTGENRRRQVQPGSRRRQICLYAAAGICLGMNVAVRMPNVVQAAFIVVVWYGAVLNTRKGRWTVCVTELSEKEAALSKDALCASKSDAAIPWQQIWKRAFHDTLWCVLGYLVGFGLPLIAICIKYGVSAYPDMVQTMFAMTEKAADYKPTSMITGMFGDYITGLCWLLFAGVCMAAAAGWLLLRAQQKLLPDHKFLRFLFPDHKMFRILCRAVYVAVWVVLLRFYWGRGMFSFRYYEYSSMYYPTVLLLLVAIGTAVYCLLRKSVYAEQKIMALAVLVLIFVTPLGSNNHLYPIINNLFLVIPFVLWVAGSRSKGESVSVYEEICVKECAADNRRQIWGFVWKTPFVILCLLVLVQSIGFHWNFVFQDGVQGEKRTICVTSPGKAAKVHTGQDNGEMLQELAEYAESAGLSGREVILYGEIPGLGYLLDMPSALSTFWPDLDSYRMTEYERDLAQIEAQIEQEGSESAPVIILASPVAAYLSEDAEAVNWFGADRKALAGDEKLQMLGAFMMKYGYQEQFANGRYAVYVTENR